MVGIRHRVEAIGMSGEVVCDGACYIWSVGLGGGVAAESSVVAFGSCVCHVCFGSRVAVMCFVVVFGSIEHLEIRCLGSFCNVAMVGIRHRVEAIGMSGEVVCDGACYIWSVGLGGGVAAESSVVAFGSCVCHVCFGSRVAVMCFVVVFGSIEHLEIRCLGSFCKGVIFMYIHILQPSHSSKVVHL